MEGCRVKSTPLLVLSLFFIDRVANYVEENSIIRGFFEKLYKQEYKKKYNTLPENIEQIHW